MRPGTTVVCVGHFYFLLSPIPALSPDLLPTSNQLFVVIQPRFPPCSPSGSFSTRCPWSPGTRTETETRQDEQPVNPWASRLLDSWTSIQHSAGDAAKPHASRESGHRRTTTLPLSHCCCVAAGSAPPRQPSSSSPRQRAFNLRLQDGQNDRAESL